MRRAQGHKLGRAFGSRNKHHILDGKAARIIAMANRGDSKLKIARKMGVSAATIGRFFREINEKSDNQTVIRLFNVS